jgi:hypothetical protein
MITINLLRPARPAMTLRVICAWCTRQITPGPPAPVSHGICPACYAAQMRELDRAEALARCQVLR